MLYISVVFLYHLPNWYRPCIFFKPCCLHITAPAYHILSFYKHPTPPSRDSRSHLTMGMIAKLGQSILLPRFLRPTISPREDQLGIDDKPRLMGHRHRPSFPGGTFLIISCRTEVSTLLQYAPVSAIVPGKGDVRHVVMITWSSMLSISSYHMAVSSTPSTFSKAFSLPFTMIYG